jgi:holliday junction DNA helicase RuvA
MIEHLRGRLQGAGKDFVVVECSGIGFRVFVSNATRADMPTDGGECLLRIFLHMREGGADLFGFSSETEREIFLALTGVGGVGPKTALSVLSVLGIGALLAGAARGDAVAFARVPGIGKKLAQRIALELPDRLKKMSVEHAPAAEDGAVAVPDVPEAEAAMALVTLGFPQGEAQVAVARARRELSADSSAEVLIREALKRMSGARPGKP